jgi:hypothetical protein
MKTGFEYELTLDTAGNVMLTQGSELMWTSEHDDEFKEDWGSDDITGEELEEVATWLVDEEYLPPGVEVHFVSEPDNDDWVDPVDGSGDDDEDSDDEGEE